MGEVTLLRTLAKKSTLNFGRKRYCTVEQLLLTTNGKTYLMFCYWRLSNISFAEDILDELGITTELRIKKPGTVDQVEFRKRQAVAEGNIGIRALAIENAARYQRARRRVKQAYSKAFELRPSVLQAKNQGHRYGSPASGERMVYSDLKRSKMRKFAKKQFKSHMKKFASKASSSGGKQKQKNDIRPPQ